MGFKCMFEWVRNLPAKQQPNGCGPTFFPVPDLVFGEACTCHDLGYTLPQRDVFTGKPLPKALTRKAVDRRFLGDMLESVKESGGNFLYKTLLKGIAHLYYVACRAFGWLCYRG